MYRTAVEVLTSHQFEHYEVSNYARHGKRSRHNQKYWKCDSTLGFGMGAASFIAGNRFSRPGTLPEYVKWLDRLDSEGFEGATREELEEEEDEKEEDDDDNAADDVSNSARINVASSPEETSGSDVDVLEVVMLALRTADGLDLDDLLQRYGKDVVGKVQRALAPYVSGGLVIYKSHAVSLAQQELGTNGSDDGTGTCTKITSEIQETVSSASAASPEAKNIVRLADPDGFIVSNDIISSVFAELT
jgi:oxygen-independent coproporphyrinogen-3 oxidase